MSHRHFCDHAGHFWDCNGTALRSLAGDTEPSVCTCSDHQVSMEDGDHSQCTVELLACPEHRDEQLREMGYEPGTSNMPPPMDEADACVFTDSDGKPTVGFCLWCDWTSTRSRRWRRTTKSAVAPCLRILRISNQCRPSRKPCWRMRTNCWMKRALSND